MKSALVFLVCMVLSVPAMASGFHPGGGQGGAGGQGGTGGDGGSSSATATASNNDKTGKVLLGGAVVGLIWCGVCYSMDGCFKSRWCGPAEDKPNASLAPVLPKSFLEEYNIKIEVKEKP